MKFLYFGDMHEWNRVPSKRTDDFLETRKEKISEILKIAKDNEVTALLQGGDFLNKDKIDSKEMARILEEWNAMDINNLALDVMLGNIDISEIELKLTNSIPMIGIIGNHELIGNEITSYEETALHSLVKNGFMKIVSKDNPIIFTDKDGTKVAITGSSYTHEIDDSDKSAYIIKEKMGDYHIHLAHGMLMDKSYGKKFKHTVVSEIAYDTKADLTINGHDHIGYSPMELDGKLFANPGSPVRLTCSKKEMERTPKVLLIDVDKTKGVTVKEIELTTAKKGEEVLSRDSIVARIAKKEKIEEIKSLITKAGLDKGLDITEIIKNLSKAKDIPSDIKDEVVSRIIDTMSKMEVPFNPKGEYIIERVHLQNFMSHKDSILNFKEGLNILAGESRNGKSAVLRGLREVYECYLKNPRSAIFRGEEFFKVTLYLSNGYIISRIVEKKKNGKNGYEILDPKTGISEYFNTKAVAKVQEILGLKKIKLSEKNKININFSTQGDGWFFIGNNLSAPDRAKLIGSIYGTQYADAVLKDINSEAMKITTKVNFYKKEIEKIEEQTEKYLYLDPLEETLNEGEAKVEELTLLEEKITKIKSLIGSLDTINKKMDKLSKLKEVLSKNEEKSVKLLEDIKKRKENLDLISKTSNKLKELLKDGREARAVNNALKNICKSEELVGNIKEIEDDITKKKEELVKYKFLNNNKIRIEKHMKVANEIVDKVKIAETNTLINSLTDLSEQIKVSKEILKTTNKLKAKEDKLSNTINTIKGDMVKLKEINKAVTLLEELKTLTEKRDTSKELLKEMNDILVKGRKAKKEKLEQVQYIKKNIALYKSELEKLGECPICKGNIDKKLITTLVEDMAKGYL